MSSDGGVRGRRVVVTGATSESGVAVCTALVQAGATVVAVGSDVGRLDALAVRVPGVETELCDLSDSAAVDTLALRLTSGAAGAAVDGLVHLVGGWVGGRGIPGQTDAGWSAMERSFRTLRNAARAFYPALLASEAGRVAFVSSSSVDRPTASGADYTAAKAASESWLRSVADGFHRDQVGRAAPSEQPEQPEQPGQPEQPEQPELRAAATIFVVKALVDDRMRAADPAKSYAGYTDVATLAEAVVALWASPAASLNGARLTV